MYNFGLCKDMFDKNKKNIIGIDDATKCPCIGSIFLAGVVANEEIIQEWQALGVKDSKLVAPKKREYLAEIIKKSALDFYITEMPPHMIDDKSYNLNEWEMVVVLKILKKLTQEPIDEIYIDNWETTRSGFDKRYEQLVTANLKKKLSSSRIIAEHRADENYTIVGAASILAKTSSDEQYRKYKKKYGDFGSGSPADPKTRLFMWQHRENPLPIMRTSWETYKHLSQLQSIDDDYIYSRVKNKKLEKKLLV